MGSTEPAATALRERIANLLRHTAPGAEAEFPYAAQFTREQIASMRQQFLPERLAPAAVLIPLVERPAGLHVLLTQRASHLKNHAGQVSFPGGRIESRDAGPWEAALREAREEIGLDPGYVTRAGFLPDHLVISGFRVTPAVGFVRPGFTLRLDTSEVEDAFEVPLEFVIDPVNRVPRERHFAGFSLTTYDIPYQGRQIWGATASMLMTLSRLLQQDTNT